MKTAPNNGIQKDKNHENGSFDKVIVVGLIVDYKLRLVHALIWLVWIRKDIDLKDRCVLLFLIFVYTNVDGNDEK